jgi:hypothetical protein
MEVTMGRLKSLIAVVAAAGLQPFDSACRRRRKVSSSALGGELPVTMVGMAPTIPVKINGKETRLMVDSGAFYQPAVSSPLPDIRHDDVPWPFGFYVRGANGTAQASVATAEGF